MSSKNLIKRIITSIPLIFLLAFSFYYSYILIISLIFISLISWLEFKVLINKIFNSNIYIFITSLFCLLYLSIFSFIVYLGFAQESFKLNMLYLFAICILSDIGGLLFGKTFKGKKLTKISPNKTISGSIGSFLMASLLAPLFYFFLNSKFSNLFDLFVIGVFTSFLCQLGDLVISFLKRKAKVKDTGNILPGHGGILDRIDGMMIGIPFGLLFLLILS